VLVAALIGSGVVLGVGGSAGVTGAGGVGALCANDEGAMRQLEAMNDVTTVRRMGGFSVHG
jgi:hypothetical protein